MYNEQILSYLSINSKMNVCVEECVVHGDLACLWMEMFCFPAVSLQGNQAITLCLMKCCVFVAQAAAIKHTHKKNTIFCYWLLLDCVHRWGSQDKAWQMSYSLAVGRCIFIRGRAMFECSLSLIPPHAEIGRNAWKWHVSNSLESNYWANAESLVAFSKGGQSMPCMHQTYVTCSCWAVSQVFSSRAPNWKSQLKQGVEKTLANIPDSSKGRRRGSEAVENGKQILQDISGNTIKCYCFLILSNYSLPSHCQQLQWILQRVSLLCLFLTKICLEAHVMIRSKSENWTQVQYYQTAFHSSWSNMLYLSANTQ